MPGLAQNDHHYQQQVSGDTFSSATTGFWSKHRDDVSYNQLQKFWSELSPQARQELLRMDKQTLFEQARKNLYCSRCNGLLLEVFLQIVMYGKSLQQEGAGAYLSFSKSGSPKVQSNGLLNIPNGFQDEAQDPSVHPWGGLITTRDGTLTLLDCYLYAKPLKALQNVFDSARARERERELLYPDACGGGGRGWISQGITTYGRGHGTRETCALHTARLSCDTLVDFWSALGEETRQSLLRMKEEDFIERLMYRFDSKRFCRDCRRNVIREFKELKELKRMRRETRCTSWFCVADTAFQYEVSDDTVQADWRQTFTDTVGTYHHFEWAIGTGEGKCDILEFDNVGMNGSVQVNGLDLGGLTACYITLRAWKLDGRCTELSVKAHALKGQQCVHCRLVVGDGYVTITKGESIRRFFEHAEEAEEEEDEESMDKDGNELDGECSRPQKHAKSPELAREFLLDAATVIFKEQVEKAFREGTARQNAHSIFVCLALKLLEERVHVACKEIITLEKQIKLLEEEEKEKREEEERKERKRAKEREKKLRRKERLKGKDKSSSDSNEIPDPHNLSKEESSPSVDDEESNSPIISGDPVCETDDTLLFSPIHSYDHDEHFSEEYTNSEMQKHAYDDGCDDGDYANLKNDSSFSNELKYSRRRLKFRKEFQPDPVFKWSGRRQYAAVSECAAMVSKSEARIHNDHSPSRVSTNGLHRQITTNGIRSISRNCGSKVSEKIHSTSNKHNFHSFSPNQNNDLCPKVESNGSTIRTVREAKFVSKSESASEITRQYHRGTKFNQLDYMQENSGRPKSKIITGSNSSSRESLYIKKVWEPMESQKYHKSNSDSDFTLCSSSVSKVDTETTGDLNVSSVSVCCDEIVENSGQNNHEAKSTNESDEFSSSGTMGPVNTDNCSLCPSEGDSNTTSMTSPHHSSSPSESEEAAHKSEEREVSIPLSNGFSNCHESVLEMEHITNGGEPFFPSLRPVQNLENENTHMGSHQHQGMHNQHMHYPPMFQTPSSMPYHHQNPIAWPQSPANILMVFPHHPHYVFTSPLSYGFNGNSSYCLPYGSLQNIASPMLNQGQVPAHQQPVAKSNGVSNESNRGRAVFDGQQRTAVAPVSTNVVKIGHSANSITENTGFSLFHFGGPVSNLSSNISDARNEADHGCYKDTTMEEYNLFAASNGLKFSLF